MLPAMKTTKQKPQGENLYRVMNAIRSLGATYTVEVNAEGEVVLKTGLTSRDGIYEKKIEPQRAV